MDVFKHKLYGGIRLWRRFLEKFKELECGYGFHKEICSTAVDRTIHELYQQHSVQMSKILFLFEIV